MFGIGDEPKETKKTKVKKKQDLKKDLADPVEDKTLTEVVADTVKKVLNKKSKLKKFDKFRK